MHPSQQNEPHPHSGDTSPGSFHAFNHFQALCEMLNALAIAHTRHKAGRARRAADLAAISALEDALARVPSPLILRCEAKPSLEGAGEGQGGGKEAAATSSDDLVFAIFAASAQLLTMHADAGGPIAILTNRIRRRAVLHHLEHASEGAPLPPCGGETERGEGHSHNAPHAEVRGEAEPRSVAGAGH